MFINTCVNLYQHFRTEVMSWMHVPNLRGSAVPRHEQGYKMLYLYNNIIMQLHDV